MDYFYLYRMQIQQTFDEDQEFILSTIQRELDRNHSPGVQLINYYKGLPVSFAAQIAAIDKKSLELDIDPQQAVTISADRYTFIRSNLFKDPILAKAQFVSVRHNAVSLRKLCFVEIMAERRKHIRLELDPAIHAQFSSSRGIIHGELIELSLGGAVIKVDQPLYDLLGDDTNLSLVIPDIVQGTTSSITLPATIVRVADDMVSGRYIFSLVTDNMAHERTIAKYLFNRQVELIREIRDARDMAV